MGQSLPVKTWTMDCGDQRSLRNFKSYPLRKGNHVLPSGRKSRPDSVENTRSMLGNLSKSSLAVRWFSKYGLHGGDWRKPDKKNIGQDPAQGGKPQPSWQAWLPVSPSQQKSHPQNWPVALLLNSVCACNQRIPRGAVGGVSFLLLFFILLFTVRFRPAALAPQLRCGWECLLNGLNCLYPKPI